MESIYIFGNVLCCYKIWELTQQIEVKKLKLRGKEKSGILQRKGSKYLCMRVHSIPLKCTVGWSYQHPNKDIKRLMFILKLFKLLYFFVGTKIIKNSK